MVPLEINPQVMHGWLLKNGLTLQYWRAKGTTLNVAILKRLG